MKMTGPKKIAHLGMLTSLAVIMGYVEYLIPFRFPVPGVKLGLTNVVILLVLYWYGFGAAAAVSLTRILLSGLLFGNLFGILYSISGMLFSLPVMAWIKRNKSFSIVGVSALGGALYNTGQIVAAVLVTGPAVIRYLPVLIIAGDITGIMIAVIDMAVLTRLSPAVSTSLHQDLL